MFKENLMEALRKAADYRNTGMSDDEAVAKSASERDFNADQTRRLVETYNTAKTICFYKNASDRSTEFSLADAGAVLKSVFGSSSEKKAEPGLHDYSCYDGSIRMESVSVGDTAPVAEYLKAASAEPERVFGDHEARSVLLKAGDYRKLAEDAEISAAAAQDDYEMAVYDLAGAVNGSGKTAEALACFGALGPAPVLDDVAGRLDPDEVKAASAVEFTSFDVERPDLTLAFEELGRLREKMAQCRAVAMTFGKMASDMEAVVRGAPEEDPSCEFFTESVRTMIDRGETVKAAQQRGGATISDPIGLMMQGVGGGVRGAVQDVAGSAAGKALAADAESRALTDKAKSLHRKFILEKLITTDPILKGVPEEDVISAYQTLVQLAPEVSLNEDVSRSILRAATGTAGSALAPYDAKTFVDLNSAITAQLEQQGGKKKPDYDKARTA